MTRADIAAFPSELHRVLMNQIAYWEKDLYRVVEFAREFLAYGPPGTGKSFIQQKRGLKGRDFERVCITAETVRGEIAGQKEPTTAFVTDTATNEKRPIGIMLDWVDGPATRSFKEGKRLIVEEINECSGDVVPFMHLIGDGKAVAGFTLQDGTYVRPHDNFQLYASMNTEPSSLPEALNDRFVVKRLVDKPDPNLLLSLPKCLRVPAAFSLFSEDKDLKVITTRQWVKMGEYMDLHGWSIAETLTHIFSSRGSTAKSLAKAIQVRSVIDDLAKMKEAEEALLKMEAE